MTLIEKGQKSALSPDETAIFERLNRTELYQLVRRAGIAASPRQTNEQLIALLVGTSSEVSSSPYDDMRAAVFAFVDENWLKIKSQLSCPAKARHPRACYGCVDAKAVHCIVGSPNMELYLSRVRDQKKDTPMPAPTSPLTTYTVKTAPRDAASLALLTSFNLKNLFKEVHKELGREYDGAAYSSFLTMARPQQTQSVLQLLAELDGGAKAKPKTKAKAPPPPPVAQEEDDEEEEESDEDEDEDEEPEADDTDDEEEEEEEEAPKAATKVRLASTVAASTAGAAAARAAAQARAAVAPAPAPAAKAAVGRPRVAVKAAPAPAPAAVEAPAASAEVLAALTELQADVKVLKETQEQIQEQIKALSSLPLGMQSLLALMLSVSEKVHKTDRASVLGLMNFDNVDDLMTPAPETQELEEPAAEEEEEPTEEEEEEEAPPPPPAKGRGKSKGKA